MKCQIMFSGKNKINISKYLLLKILPRVLSVKGDTLLHVRNFLTYARKGSHQNISPQAITLKIQINAWIRIMSDREERGGIY